MTERDDQRALTVHRWSSRRTMLALFGLVLIAVGIGAYLIGRQWGSSNRMPTVVSSIPGWAGNGVAATDKRTGQTILFAADDDVVSGAAVMRWDTWIWDGHVWKESHPRESPPPMFGETMAYDPATQEVVLFGGLGEYPPYNVLPLGDLGVDRHSMAGGTPASKPAS